MCARQASNCARQASISENKLLTVPDKLQCVPDELRTVPDELSCIPDTLRRLRMRERFSIRIMVAMLSVRVSIIIELQRSPKVCSL
jgi:hypothetical protein